MDLVFDLLFYGIGHKALYTRVVECNQQQGIKGDEHTCRPWEE